MSETEKRTRLTSVVAIQRLADDGAAVQIRNNSGTYEVTVSRAASGGVCTTTFSHKDLGKAISHVYQDVME